MKKKLFIISIACTVLTLGILHEEKSTFASSISSPKNNLRAYEKYDDIDITEKLRHELGDLSYALTYNKLLAHEINDTELLPYNGTWDSLLPISLSHSPLVKVNDDMKLEDGDTIAAQSATLTNSTPSTQNMSSASFTYSQTDSITTTTTHAVGASLTTSAEMKFPFVSGSVSFTAKYDFSSSEAVTSSITKEWTVPSQSVQVPAGHTYKLNWVLNTGTASGTSKLTSQVSAQVPYKIDSFTGERISYEVGQAMDAQNDLINGLIYMPQMWDENNNWEKLDDSTALRKWGTATYKAKIGTELIMEIIDVTSSQDTRIVKRVPMNISPRTVG
ncbi:ETX/MTX2 family pore-forming toxin [Lactococcus garvieae]|uniref:ETX/MTX2 family pore-forming toxin n=1 Tax=Lactococcus garvieae TaxID=1363 RepID=UPI0022E70185|nr:ETX/MTX2 family pore-forming toxin [Lactococcus garvieae]